MLKLPAAKPVPNPVDTSETSAQPTIQSTESETPSDISWLHTPKQSGKFAWLLIVLTTLISLGLHLVLMFFPLPEEQKPVAAKPEEKKVRITQLPTLNKPGPKVPIAKSTPKVVPVPRTPIPRITSIPPIQAPKPPTPQAVPQSASSASPANSAPSDANPWQDFPQYPGAQAGCYNLPSCMQTGSSLSDVSSYFERELTNKKYSVSKTISESDRTVFQVTRNNITQFLSLINVPGKGTLYVLAEQPRALADLGDAVEVPAEIYSVLSGLAAADATRDQFAQPEAFYSADSPKPEIGIMQVVTGEAPDTFFDTYLRTNLFNNGFESSQLTESYGGGIVYEVKKENAALYINLVPTQDGSGTIVVIWKNLPK